MPIKASFRECGETRATRCSKQPAEVGARCAPITTCLRGVRGLRAAPPAQRIPMLRQPIARHLREIDAVEFGAGVQVAHRPRHRCAFPVCPAPPTPCGKRAGRSARYKSTASYYVGNTGVIRQDRELVFVELGVGE